MNEALKPPESWTAWSKSRQAGWKTPFLLLEWLSQWIAYRVDRWAFLRVLEYTGKAVLFIAAIMYICNSSDSKALRHGQAWIDMKDLYLDGINEPLELSWTSTGSGTSKKFFFTAFEVFEHFWKPGVFILRQNNDLNFITQLFYIQELQDVRVF